MKINELFDFRPRKIDQAPHDYDKEISKQYKSLGTGLYASVYKQRHMNRDYAVKIIKIDYPGYKPSRDALIEYYKECMKTKNPFFPKIYGLRAYKHIASDGKPEHMYVVHMEKLTPVSGKFRTLARAIDEYLEAWHNGDEDIEKQLCYKLMQRSKNLTELIFTLMDISKKYNDVSVDTHEANVMVRNGNQLVITDPFTH